MTFRSRLFDSLVSGLIIVPLGSTPGSRKYCAICCLSFTSAWVRSQRTMNSAIIAVTKSA